MARIRAFETASLIHLVPLASEWTNVNVQDMNRDRREMPTSLVLLDRLPCQFKDLVDAGERGLLIAVAKMTVCR